MSESTMSDSAAPKFERHVREQREVVRRSETLSLTVGEYDVAVALDSDFNPPTISVAPRSWDRARYGGIVQMHPKNVAELEAFADVAPVLLRAIAASLRAEGIEDMRSRSDIMEDEMEARRAEYLAKMKARG